MSPHNNNVFRIRIAYKIRSLGFKTIFMLNSAEYEISFANRQ